MSVLKIASRYARSFIDLAIEQEKLDIVHSDFELILHSINNSRELQGFFKSPIINADTKQRVMDKIFGNKWNELTEKYVHLIIAKGREPFLRSIIEEFLRQYNEIKGITHVTISSATILSADVQQQLKKAIQDTTGAKEIIIEQQIDPSLIGGFVISVGDKMYDASVSHKLQALKKQLINA